MQNTDTIKQVISRVDTLYVDRVDPLYHEAYIKLLERSNEQLSLVGNPLAWMIGALGVLFTVGAIVTAFLLWRQSKEFKDKQNEILQEFSASKDEYTKLAISMRGMEQEFNNSLSEVKNKLIETKEFNPSQTSTIETTINEAAKKVKDALSASREIVAHSVQCKSCKKSYIQQIPPGLSAFLLANVDKRLTFPSQCPNCGSVQNNILS